MGEWSYICRHCGKSIRIGENCVLIHVRNGKEKGKVLGHYDGYGGVEEEDNLCVSKFRGEKNTGINGMNEIAISSFYSYDSYYPLSLKKMYNNETIDYIDYLKIRAIEELEKHHYNFKETYMYRMLKSEKFKKYCERYGADGLDSLKKIKFDIMELEELKNSNISLPKMKWNIEGYFVDSYIIYYIQLKLWQRNYNNLENIKLDNYSGIVCYHNMCYTNIDKKKISLIPSDFDPHQGNGGFRDKFL